jgi:hypothetical protein
MFRPRLQCIVLIALLGLPFRALSDRETNLIARATFPCRIFEGHLQRMDSFTGVGTSASQT